VRRTFSLPSLDYSRAHLQLALWLRCRSFITVTHHRHISTDQFARCSRSSSSNNNNMRRQSASFWTQSQRSDD